MNSFSENPYEPPVPAQLAEPPAPPRKNTVDTVTAVFAWIGFIVVGLTLFCLSGKLAGSLMNP